ncbi:hypothetical protein JOF56_002796 [Kibdelosporangium banguiense]|uniref:Uncharacterized protein n=1 Tax=Kibdelosporangium banguiense TaxID=1365924 RepID=A0ABS4TDB1_9PSEU|nr:hypothetical protein [Kibdelosporangium banguiense]MBP2322411.1 hypothetical protein [Kibdelosporangium banguiense]
MARTKTAAPKFKLVRGGSKKRKFVALLVFVAVVALVVRYPVESADLVTTVVGGFADFVKALSA